MAQHAGYHEPIEKLSDLHHLNGIAPSSRSWRSSRRLTGTTNGSTRPADDTLKAVLAHNRDEEREHAAMTLEWLRRNDPGWDRILRTYLFQEGPITEIEAATDAQPGELNLGSLRGSRAPTGH